MTVIALSFVVHALIAFFVWMVGALLFTHLIFGARRRDVRWQDRVVRRYQRHFWPLPWIYTSPWVYAWFKVRLDPMANELPTLLPADARFKTAIDVGCGWGVPSCMLLEMQPELTVHAIEPGRYRSYVARRAFGSRGTVIRGFAPDALRSKMPDRCDLVLSIDVLHLMPPDAVRQTLAILREKLVDDGVLVARINVPQAGKRSTIWILDATHRALTRARSFHRPIEEIVQIVQDSGFTIQHRVNAGGNAEMVWLVARPTVASTADPASQVPVLLCEGDVPHRS